MKLQKVMLDAGFSCPNRDGKKGYGGCTFCRTESYNPAYCRSTASITQQLEAGKHFMAGKYPEMKYLAYFQAFSNTYAPVEVLRQRYEEALDVEDVVGLVIGTRPDCLSDEVLDLLDEIRERHGCDITIEIGVESFYDKTLRRINRGHDAQCSMEAIKKSANRGFPIGIHLILGLPGESINEILSETELINTLPIHSIKLHQLQILQGTPMAKEYRDSPEDFLQLSADAYVELVVRFVRRLKREIHVERYASSAPADLLIAPHWGLKPAEIQRRVLACLSQNTPSL